MHTYVYIYIYIYSICVIFHVISCISGSDGASHHGQYHHRPCPGLPLSLTHTHTHTLVSSRFSMSSMSKKRPPNWVISIVRVVIVLRPLRPDPETKVAKMVFLALKIGHIPNQLAEDKGVGEAIVLVGKTRQILFLNIYIHF